ncbi:MAG: alpha-2-macroglobulin family protein [Bacteroidales bacterium]
MKTKKIILVLGIAIVAIGSAFALYKYVFKGKAEISTMDFSSYVAAHTSGTISKTESIRVVFSSDIVKVESIGKEADSRIFRISPSEKGELIWHNERTLEFRPETNLSNDTEYRVTISLDRLFDKIPKDFKEFTFAFRTIKQAMELKVSGIEFYDDPKNEERRVAGQVFTADYAEPESIKETISATQNGDNLEISWSSSGDGRTHHFWIEGVKQTDETGKVAITSKGKPIDVHDIGYQETEIPPKGVFRILSHNVIQAPEQCIEIRFSEPIDPSQNMQGLIRASGMSDARIIIEGNVARVYPSSRLTGSYSFEVSPGVRSINRQRLEEGSDISVTFEVIKPQVKLVGQGVILPSSGGLLFPFQAVSLRAVDVSIVKVFSQNVAQFMQVNNLGGQSELRRVGRLIRKKTVLLNQAGQVDYNKWNTYNIDLSELIKTEPGAIYQVSINFRKEYSTYSCNGETDNESLTIIDERYNPTDDIARSHYYASDYPYDYYNWRERDNPCKVSYYRNKSVSRNVLASDFGMIAKAGADGGLMVAVTDLNTAQPINGIEIDIFNYQQQLIKTATTDSKGMALFEFQEHERAFLAVAKQGEQRGYLKVDNGSTLSLSSFDVSGVAVQKGLKGFMYGERGVWRPGDTLFISFILEDKGKTLPENHPVNFELTNPRGQQVYHAVANQSVEGMYSFPVITNKDDPTGNYTARVKVGGVTFSEVFKVETIMPNRLKIDLKIEDDALRYGKVTTASFSSAWLHGAPARNLKVQVDAVLSQSTTTFDNYNGFSFDDPARSFYAEEQTIFEGKLDEKGEVNFSPNISVKSTAPGKLNAHFTARVFEQGGAFSIDRFTVPYYPYRNFVGLKMPEPQNRRGTYLTDTTHNVSIVLVNSNGNPVSRKRINVEVYKIDWRWWWERGNEDLSNYITGSYHRPIQKGSVTTGSNGKAAFDLRINHPEWGRFLVRAVDPDGGHATGTIAYFDWPGWYSRDKRATPEAASMLVFSSDKEAYNVGETVNINIPSPDGGKIFLTVENGVKVLQSHWIDASAGETQFSIIASDDMAPNVYINAMLIQPHGQTKNDLPIRMYGVVPIGVENPQTHLEPQIKMPDVLEPEQKVSITVSEKEGKPMAFTLAIVDDGLLDLTRFRTPNPWRSFYAREALGVRTWDLYDMVLGASSGRMQRIISIGGDEEATGQGDQTANRFKPVVKYFGPYKLAKGKSERIEFTMPNYVGSVRVMAVAAKDGAYGSAEKTVPVRKPLMVLATLPRVLGPEEDVVLPVTVFAMEDKVKNVKVRIEPNEMLSIKGNKEQTVRFDDVGDKMVRFNLKAASKLGVARIKVYAESGREKASHEIELDVRNPNPPMTLVQDTVLKEGQSWKPTYEAFGIEGTNTASVELSTLPPINLGRRLKFLLGYPHGCLEQTVSKAFPQLFISKLADVDENVKRSAEENVRYALDRLRSFRTSDGGLSLWPGSAYPDEWASTYAGHFLLEAQRLGYTIPSGILDGWKRSTQRVAQNWSPARQSGYRNSDLMQAYRLYVLALAKSPQMGAMNRLRESSNLSVAAKWRLAGAYVLAGNPEAAKSLISNAPLSVNTYREQSYTYGSDTRDRAMIVETLVLLGDFEKAMPLLSELSQKLSANRWMSTQETSYSLLAFSKFAEASKASEGISARLSIDGGSAKKQNTKQPILQHAFNPVQSGSGKVSVENTGQGMLYARLINHGMPVGGKEVAQSNNLQIEVNYYLMDGSRVTPETMTQGTDFYADVRVYNPGTRGDLEQLILSLIVPSGWEIRTSRLDEGSSLQSSPYDYQDIRDDRVYTYFNLQQGQAKSFQIRFNATYEGRFYMPGIACEAMYDNSINARKAGGWVNVEVP